MPDYIFGFSDTISLCSVFYKKQQKHAVKRMILNFSNCLDN